MFSIFLIYFLILKSNNAQEDGQFWWLNEKFTKYVGTQPPLPMFEKITKLDTDETAKITFKDDNFFKENYNAIKNSDLKPYNDIRIQEAKSDPNIIRWPDENVNGKSDSRQIIEDQIHAAPTVNRFVFIFPSNNNAHKNRSKLTTESPTLTATETNPFNNDITNNTSIIKEKLSENICTFMKKSECYQKKGALNVDIKDEKKYILHKQLICCILPMKTTNENVYQNIKFPDIPDKKRWKRSKYISQRQRNLLLRHHYENMKYRTRPPTLNSDEYDYEDPYVNIKNHKQEHRRKQQLHTKHEGSNEYQDDYAAEIPAPGLTGIYSDINDNKDVHYGTLDYEEDGDVGYSTIDPRIGHNKKSKSKPYRPYRFASHLSGSDELYDESHTISYHSEPNFNILQDFKLPNLTRKKATKQKTTRSTTTDSLISNESNERFDSEEIDKTSEKKDQKDCGHKQIYKDCGKASFPLTIENKQWGDLAKGAHPWLAILVPSNKENKLLCYASIIHPRAAITAGDCVHGTATGELTLIAGLYDLSERSNAAKRVVTVLLHNDYQNGDLNNNLALVHWKRPLKLGNTVQPICVANAEMDHECTFVGWGGFDQPIRTLPRWQRATIHDCKGSPSLAGMVIPGQGFCASVVSRSTVTGIGGSLVCKLDGHLSAVGVAVSRDSTLLLLPIKEWVTSPIIVNFVGKQED